MIDKELSYFSYVNPKETKYKKNVNLPLDSYYLGFWIGDGHSNSLSTFTCGGEVDKGGCNDQTYILPYMKNIAKSFGLDFKERNYKDGECLTFAMNNGIGGNNPFNKIFKTLNLKNNKHIPEIYLRSSIEERKKLLAGLVDSDGTSNGDAKKNYYWDVIQKNKRIIDDIEILCKSLGMFTRRTERKCRAKKKDGTYSEYITCYRITIIPINNKNIPLLLKRKSITNEYDKKYIKIRNNVLDSKITKTIWTDEMKIMLYSIVKRFKDIEPNSKIKWKELSLYSGKIQRYIK